MLVKDEVAEGSSFQQGHSSDLSGEEGSIKTYQHSPPVARAQLPRQG